MRIGVVSDTHGMLDFLDCALAKMGQVDALIHLGDYTSDVPYIQRHTQLQVYSVSGNCDAPDSAPGERVIVCDGVRLFLTHGHRYGVKRDGLRLIYRANELGCSAALYGHTHQPELNYECGVLLINPGSLSRPRGGSQVSCAVLEIEDGEVQARLLPLSD